MSFAKISDQIFAHPTFIELSLPAVGVWVTALSAAVYEGYGGIDWPRLHRLTRVREFFEDAEARSIAGELVKAGLWAKTTHGWEIVGFCDNSSPHFRVVNLAARDEWDEMRPQMAPKVMQRDGHRCVYCSSPMDLTVDHVLPLSRGGRSDLENLVTACRSCNSSKSARTPEEWKGAR